MTQELETKLARVEELLADHQLDALLLQNVANFAWLTNGGASYINTADSLGVGALLITSSGRYLITNNIEAPRFRDEEGLEDQGWEFKIAPWYQTDETIQALTKGTRLGTDVDCPGGTNLAEALRCLRMDLLPEEQQRFQDVSRGCAQAMQAAIQAVQPGMTEYQIGSILNQETFARGILPIVNLIATDRRIYTYRHPLPTGKPLDRYAMLVLCGRKKGLVASITRLVYFGDLPDKLRQKQAALGKVDATFIAATRPGATMGQVFERARNCYAEVGFADEWQLHHQGGPAGYEPREFVATPGDSLPIKAGQGYAWNPSITGTKSEDTILVGPDGGEILTAIDGWPTLSYEVDGRQISRPAILEVA